jgi:hypothetical protein
VHQVRPWFAGRLDFAPVVPFAGDAEYPLRGGTVEYFLDRRAAVFVFGRRLHAISLFVFRPEGLPMPTREGEQIEHDIRGFNTVVWRPAERPGAEGVRGEEVEQAVAGGHRDASGTVHYDHLYIGGGNAKTIRFRRGSRVTIISNEAGIGGRQRAEHPATAMRRGGALTRLVVVAASGWRSAAQEKSGAPPPAARPR